jgi:hypothetical protein
MSAVMVRYRVREDAAEENAALVRAVMEELAAAGPAGLRYTVAIEDDGATFVHFALHEGEAKLTDFSAFQAFLADHASRCVEGPVTTRMRVVGAYSG